jgi:hypothetical protein
MDTDADKTLTYRQRAEHTRVIARGMPNPETREAMLKFAQDYDYLADNIDMTPAYCRRSLITLEQLTATVGAIRLQEEPSGRGVCR